MLYKIITNTIFYLICTNKAILTIFKIVKLIFVYININGLYLMIAMVNSERFNNKSIVLCTI